METAKTCAFWLVFGVGAGVFLMGAFWVIDAAITYITKSLGIYNDIIQFMWKKRRGKT